MSSVSFTRILLLVIGLGANSVVLGEDQRAPVIRYDTIHHPVTARYGMVVSQREVASQIGADILAKGGNAVDAAVATGFALAVNLPRAGNIGGGGFMLIHLAESKETIALDYRERAPAAATHDMYLREDGSVDGDKARRSIHSSGVPGTVAGLLYALDNYGTMSRREVMAPAINLARRGITVSWDFAEVLKARESRLKRNEAAAAMFYKPDGSTYEPGDRFVQKDLARVLSDISRKGASAFYEGRVAKLLLAEMERQGGIITAQDLKDYEVAVREPLTGTYRGYDIVSMPPSSSGGVHVIQMLNVLSHFPLREWGVNSARSIHVVSEVMKRAYADRSQHLGDMDFYPVPIEWLTSDEYASQLAASISMDKVTPSTEVKPGEAPAPESPDTTHYSVADQFGNVVSQTYTLNFSFGSGIVVPGAGFLLNNEMDDFSAKPGVPNQFGLLGNEANKIEPGKRPLSSMTPTLVFKEGEPYLVTGSPGGSRIITAVLQVILGVLEYDLNVMEATVAPRIHHQWLPDRLEVEAGHNADVLRELEALGHPVRPAGSQGSTQSIMVRDGLFFGASDTRRPGAGAVGVDTLD